MYFYVITVEYLNRYNQFRKKTIHGTIKEGDPEKRFLSIIKRTEKQVESDSLGIMFYHVEKIE